MADGMKTQIRARLLELLDPLKTDGVTNVKRIVVHRDVLQAEDSTKAIHIVLGDEEEAVEWNQGFQIDLPIAVKLVLKADKDVDAKLDEFKALVIAKLEANNCQLEKADGTDPLVHSIKYTGDVDGTPAASPESGLLLLYYLIRYRRKHADYRTSF